MQRLPLAALLLLVVGALNLSAQEYPEDHSLEMSVYRSLGVPSVDEPWGNAAYHQAIGVLDSIARTSPMSLPQFNSPHSGALFARMVSLENLPASDREKADRMLAMMPLTDMIPQLLSVYAEPAGTGLIFDNELAEIFGFLIGTASQISTLTVDMLAEGGSAMTEEASNKELEQMREGLAEMLSGAMQFMGKVPEVDAVLMRTPARLSLARHMEQHFPQIVPLLLDAGRDEVRVQLRGVLGVEKDPQVKKILKKLEQQVKPGKAGEKGSSAGRTKKKRN